MMSLRWNNFNHWIQRRIQISQWRPIDPRGGSANLLFAKIYAENCMKMKEFGLSAPLHQLLEFPAS